MSSAINPRLLTLFFSDPPISLGAGPVNLIGNPGFEIAGTMTVTPTGTDVFSEWTEFDAGYELVDEPPPEDEGEGGSASFSGLIVGAYEAGTGVIVQHPAYAEGVTPKSVIITQDVFDEYAGTYCCKMYSNRGGNVYGAVWQFVDVEPYTPYRLSFYTKTDTGLSIEQGRFRVHDADNNKDIVPLTNSNAISDEWVQVSCYFVTEDTARIAVLLYQNIHQGSSVFYDNVELRKRGRQNTAPDEEIAGPAQYSHTITASGGYDTMTAGFPLPIHEIPRWFENGLFRRVRVHDGVSKVWEGFVDQVAVTIGALTFTIGPVKSLTNRAKIVFREMSYATNPPTGGATVSTHFVDVEDSQDLYGIFESVITGGSGSYDEMSELLATILTQVSKPEVVQGFSMGGTEINISITCAGYNYLLEKFIYNNTGQAGMVAASEKIRRVLRADPNGIFSIRNSRITENALEVKSYENEDKNVRTIITEIVALGDVNDNRYHWGVYDDQEFVYEPVTGVTPEYSQSVHDGLVRDMSGAAVAPWLVRPAKWMTIGDLLPGRPIDTSRYRDDPRILFIESVNFSLPYTLSITAGKATTFRQQLDRLGLGGIQ